MRKIALFVLTLLLLSVSVFPLAGCTSGQLELVEVNIDDILARYPASDYTYDGESVTLSMVHWTAAGAELERKTTEAVLEGFKKRYPTINVELEILDDYENQYANRFAAGNVHDVFVVPDGVFNLWVSGSDCPMMSLDNLLQYSTLLSEENRSEMISTALNRYKYNPSTRLIGDTPGAQQSCLR